MQIPIFALPSRPDSTVIFRMPKVRDAKSWANASPELEEANITRYLGEMLESPTTENPLLWTAQDRWTALWWIFVNSRLEPIVTVAYPCDHCKTEPCQKCVEAGKGDECEHCKDTHYYDCDMGVLIESVGMLTVEPFLAIDVPVEGEMMQWLIKPLDGRAAEHLERVRLSLPDEDHPDYKEALVELDLLEIAHQAHLIDQPDDFMQAVEHRYNLIQEMDIDTEFSVLVANVEIARRSLAHGLEMRMERGETTILLPDHHCPTIKKKKGEALAPTTRLYTPFRPRDFLPIIKSRRVGNAHK
jgi:hypothetical protein